MWDRGGFRLAEDFISGFRDILWTFAIWIQCCLSIRWIISAFSPLRLVKWNYHMCWKSPEVWINPSIPSSSCLCLGLVLMPNADIFLLCGMLYVICSALRSCEVIEEWILSYHLRLFSQCHRAIFLLVMSIPNSHIRRKICPKVVKANS